MQGGLWTVVVLYAIYLYKKESKILQHNLLTNANRKSK